MSEHSPENPCVWKEHFKKFQDPTTVQKENINTGKISPETQKCLECTPTDKKTCKKYQPLPSDE